MSSSQTASQYQASSGFQPYIGLRPFTEQEKDRFFGRSNEASILLDKIRANRLTLLLAASGVGKSSLLQAGIMPELRTDSNIELIYYNVWSASPQAFKQAVSEHYGEPYKDVSLKSILRSCTLFSSSQLVLLLDQFEELFNYHRFKPEFQPFIEELSAAILDRSLPVSFVFSMREDFALELNSFKESLPGVFDNYFRLEKLTCEQAREAIEKPLKGTGYCFAPETGNQGALLDQVLHDLAKREQERQFGVQELLALKELPLLVEPPHLQIVCRELWDRHLDQKAKQITHTAYEKAGRTAGILSSYFLGKIALFSKKEQALASSAFDHLIGQRSTKIAHSLERLAELARADKKELQLVLNKLQDYAILRRQKRGEEFWYELYHDIFSESIDNWNREFKARQRIKRLACGSIAVLIIGSLLFTGNNWQANHYGRYLQLSNKTDISDRIETYQGTEKGLDLFHQRQFLYETPFRRKQLEADKRFSQISIEEKNSAQAALVGRLPMLDRVPLYAADGFYSKIYGGRDNLAEVILKTSQRDFIKELPQQLAQVRTKKSLAFLSQLIQKEDVSSEVKVRAAKAIANLDAKPEMVRFLSSELIKILSSAEWEIRQEIVSVLSWLKEDSVAPDLMELLKDKKPEVRRAAATALGRLKIESAVSDLITLLQDEDFNVRQAAASALGKLGAKSAAAGLIRLLKSKSLDASAAAEALGRLKVDSAVPNILTLLNSRSSDVRQAAVTALGQLKAKSATPDIVKLLRDEDAQVRKEAARVLGWRLKANVAIPDLARLLKDENSGVRGEAVSALGYLKADLAVPDLISILKDEDPRVRREAVGIFYNLKKKFNISDLVKLLEDERPDVRQSAVSALGRLKDDLVLPHLIPLLKDEDPGMRQMAVEALGRLEAQDALPDIIMLLKDKKAYVRQAAATALGWMKADSAVPDLVELLQDENSELWLSAIQALGQIGADSAISNITAMLMDRHPEVRGGAASALGRLDADSAVPNLIRLLADGHFEVRKSAVLALGQLETYSTLPYLVKALKENDDGNDEYDKQVRAAAIYGLRNLKACFLFPDIINLLMDENSFVRWAAISTLGELKAKVAEPDLVKLLNDEDEYIQQSAALSLGILNSSSPQLQNWRDHALVEVQKKIASGDRGWEVYRILGSVFTKQSSEIISQLLDDPDQVENAIYAIYDIAQFHPEWINTEQVLELLQHTDLELRQRAVFILGQVISFHGNEEKIDPSAQNQAIRNALVALIKDPRQENYLRLSAIHALGQTKRKECAQLLYKLLPSFDRRQEQDEVFRSHCLLWLGRMAYSPAFEYAEADLLKLENDKAAWRIQRNQDSISGGNKLQDDALWQQREYRIGSVLAQISPEEKGVELLAHPLYSVRQGAIYALAGRPDAVRIEKIIQAHQNFDPDDLPSPFPYAAFRAIDLALWNLEYTGKKEDVTKLKDILKNLKPCQVPGQEGAIKERLEWTIDRLDENLAKNAERATSG